MDSLRTYQGAKIKMMIFDLIESLQPNDAVTSVHQYSSIGSTSCSLGGSGQRTERWDSIKELNEHITVCDLIGKHFRSHMIQSLSCLMKKP